MRHGAPRRREAESESKTRWPKRHRVKSLRVGLPGRRCNVPLQVALAPILSWSNAVKGPRRAECWHAERETVSGQWVPVLSALAHLVGRVCVVLENAVDGVLLVLDASPYRSL